MGEWDWIKRTVAIAYGGSTKGPADRRITYRAVLPSNGRHCVVYRAYFVDGLNIALVENLMTVVRQLGLPEDEAREVLVSQRFRDAVDADWRRCRNLGITAVPTFVVGHEGVMGAQPYDVLEPLIVAGGAVRQ